MLVSKLLIIRCLQEKDQFVNLINQTFNEVWKDKKLLTITWKS